MLQLSRSRTLNLGHWHKREDLFSEAFLVPARLWAFGLGPLGEPTGGLHFRRGWCDSPGARLGTLMTGLRRESLSGAPDVETVARYNLVRCELLWIQFSNKYCYQHAHSKSRQNIRTEKRRRHRWKQQ